MSVTEKEPEPFRLKSYLGGSAMLEKRLLTDAEAAKYLSLSPSFLRQCRMKGTTKTYGPPFIRIGRAVRYDITILDKWITDHDQT